MGLVEIEMKSSEEVPGSLNAKGAMAWVVLVAVWMTLAVGPTAQATRPLQRIAVNGGELEYEVNGTGEPVLLIHGTGVAATFASDDDAAVARGLSTDSLPSPRLCRQLTLAGAVLDEGSGG